MNNTNMIYHLRSWYKTQIDIKKLSPDDAETELLELIREAIGAEFSK